MKPQQRPLSPHLQIYKPQITSVLSITHRATGVALSVGTLVLVAWLWAAAYSAPCYQWLTAQLKTPVGLALLGGWSLAFYYHLGNGIRHLFWDAGKGFSIPAVYRSGALVLLFAAVMTAGTWACVYRVALQQKLGVPPVAEAPAVQEESSAAPAVNSANTANNSNNVKPANAVNTAKTDNGADNISPENTTAENAAKAPQPDMAAGSTPLTPEAAEAFTPSAGSPAVASAANSNPGANSNNEGSHEHQ